MTNRTLALIAVAVVVLVGVLYLKRNESGQVGGAAAFSLSGSHSPAPDFTISDLDGKKLALTDYKGKVILLDFWATWCVPCRQEIPQFVGLQNRYGAQGLRVIGISMDDSPKPVRDFYQQFHINYPVGMGDSKLQQLYGGLIGLPINFVIGRDGRVYSKHIGVTPGAGIEEEIKALLAAPPPSA